MRMKVRNKDLMASMAEWLDGSDIGRRKVEFTTCSIGLRCRMSEYENGKESGYGVGAGLQMIDAYNEARLNFR